jgi:hypothetical protein
MSMRLRMIRSVGGSNGLRESLVDVSNGTIADGPLLKLPRGTTERWNDCKYSSDGSPLLATQLGLWRLGTGNPERIVEHPCYFITRGLNASSYLAFGPSPTDHKLSAAYLVQDGVGVVTEWVEIPRPHSIVGPYDETRLLLSGGLLSSDGTLTLGHLVSSNDRKHRPRFVSLVSGSAVRQNKSNLDLVDLSDGREEAPFCSNAALMTLWFANQDSTHSLCLHMSDPPSEGKRPRKTLAERRSLLVVSGGQGCFSFDTDLDEPFGRWASERYLFLSDRTTPRCHVFDVGARQIHSSFNLKSVNMRWDVRLDA